MGNFFSMMVCALFDAFWLSNGLVHLPSLGLAAPYSASGTDNIQGATSPEYNAALALFYIIWGFALVTYTVFTLRTNVVFLLIFAFSFVGTFTLSGAFWKVSTGDFVMAHNLQMVSEPFRFLAIDTEQPNSQAPDTDVLAGWRCAFVCRGRSGVVHDPGHYVSGNGDDHETACRRSQPFLVWFGRGDGGGWKGREKRLMEQALGGCGRWNRPGEVPKGFVFGASVPARNPLKLFLTGRLALAGTELQALTECLVVRPTTSCFETFDTAKEGFGLHSILLHLANGSYVAGLASECVHLKVSYDWRLLIGYEPCGNSFKTPLNEEFSSSWREMIVEM